MKTGKTKTLSLSSSIGNKTVSNSEFSPKRPLCIFAVSLYHDFARIKQPQTDKSIKKIAECSYGRMLQNNPDAQHDAISESFSFIEPYIKKTDYPALIVYSLWTTSCNSEFYKKELAKYSHNCPILLEKYIQDDCYKVEIWQHGSCVFSRPQTISSSSERSSSNEDYQTLLQEINSGARFWTHPETGHRFLVLICGEINVVIPKGNGYQLDEMVHIEKGVHGVINPSHTRFKRYNVRKKQKYLSKRFGCTVSCNNTFLFHWKGGKDTGKNPCWQNSNKIENYNELSSCYINTFELGT